MEINSLIESAGLGHVERILRQSTDYTTIVTINESGERYVLKLSDKSQYDRRYREFEYLKLMSESQQYVIPLCRTKQSCELFCERLMREL